jgi:hypothetical protein
MKRHLRENVEQMYANTRKPGEPPTFAEYEEKLGTNELARVHGKLIMDLMLDSKMGRLIFNMHWGILAFRNHRHELLTSDRPVVSNQFPISANHMCLPISPTILFVACATEQAQSEFQVGALVQVTEHLSGLTKPAARSRDLRGISAVLVVAVLWSFRGATTVCTTVHSTPPPPGNRRRLAWRARSGLGWPSRETLAAFA